MAVLVAGIGYVGAQLVSDLLASGEEVVGVDNLFSTDPAAIERLADHNRFHFIPGSFGDRRLLDKAFRLAPIEVVYSLAAQSSGHPEAAPPRYTETANLLAPRVLLEAMRHHGVGAVVYASSMHVYGGTERPDAGEETPYGVARDLAHLSKVYGEKLHEMYAAQYGVRCVAARIGIVYGLSPVMKRDFRFMTAPNKFCLQAARGEPPTVYPGRAVDNAFIHVADASGALRSLAAHAAGGYRPVNVVAEWTSVATVAAIVRALANGDPLPDPLLVRSEIGPRLAESGFQPRHALAEGLAPVLDLFRSTEQTAPAKAGAR